MRFGSGGALTSAFPERLARAASRRCVICGRRGRRGTGIARGMAGRDANPGRATEPSHGGERGRESQRAKASRESGPRVKAEKGGKRHHETDGDATSTDSSAVVLHGPRPRELCLPGRLQSRSGGHGSSDRSGAAGSAHGRQDIGGKHRRFRLGGDVGRGRRRRSFDIQASLRPSGPAGPARRSAQR